MASRQESATNQENISLDWRHGCTRKELVDKLYQFLLQIDDNGFHTMLLSGSNVQEIEEQETDDKIVRMWVHRQKWTKKTLGTKSGDDYIPQIYAVTRHLLNLISHGLPTHKRMFDYELRMGNFTADKIARMWYDLAFTLNEHPFRFRVVPDCQGLFSMPRRWTITIRRVENILKYLDSSKDPAA
jgi:hypothetical protein